MTQHSDATFEQSSQGAVSAITAFGVVVSFLLAFGGMVLFSYAFAAEGPNLFVFTAGLIATVLGFMVPFAWLPVTGK